MAAPPIPLGMTEAAFAVSTGPPGEAVGIFLEAQTVVRARETTNAIEAMRAWGHVPLRYWSGHPCRQARTNRTSVYHFCTGGAKTGNISAPKPRGTRFRDFGRAARGTDREASIGKGEASTQYSMRIPACPETHENRGMAPSVFNATHSASFL